MRNPVAPAFLLLAGLCTPALAQITTRVSVDSLGNQGPGPSAHPGLSSDGRFVVFKTDNSFVPQDTGFIGDADVYRRDNLTGAVELVSWNRFNTAQGGGGTMTGAPSVTTDGRFVVFDSPTTNLVANDTNGTWDVFVRDMQLGITERVSVLSGGGESALASWSWRNAISDDGRYVLFSSADPMLDPNFGPPATGGTPAWTLYVRDRQTQTTTCVATNSFADRDEGVISADGTRIAYRRQWGGSIGTQYGQEIWTSQLSSLGLETKVSPTSSFAATNPTLTSPGDRIVFDLGGGIFIRDVPSWTLSMPVGANSGGAMISADGAALVFGTINRPAGWCYPPGLGSNIFVMDLASQSLTAVNIGLSGCFTSGTQDLLAISRAGACVAYGSASTDLVVGDTNQSLDVFLFDAQPAHFTSFCDPGTGGTLACPCFNPPSGAGRGCDNSSGTGGAVLSASGAAYLTADSLTFATAGEEPSALSILVQGSSANAAGIAFGQGVRCVSGGLKRLFTRAAIGGSLSFPDPGAGDPPISVRSAAAGDPIHAGDTRYYLVYYRDSIMLGGCSASNSFNATQSGAVTWRP